MALKGIPWVFSNESVISYLNLFTIDVPRRHEQGGLEFGALHSFAYH